MIEHAASVHDLAQSLELKNYILVGHSMGGKIAMAIAAIYPLKIRGLVLIAPSPPFSEPFKRGERVALRNAFGNETELRTLLQHASVRTFPTKIFETAVSDSLRTSAKAWIGWLDKGSRENILTIVRNITCLVLVLAGEKDKKFPTSFLKKALLPKINGAAMREITSVGHLIPLEAPGKTASAMKEFFGDL